MTDLYDPSDRSANPADPEAERKFLACLLHDQESAGKSVELVSGDDFEKYPNLASAMLELASDSFIVERHAVEQIFDPGIPPEITKMDVPGENAEVFAEEILRLSRKRRAIKDITSLAKESTNGLGPDEIAERTEEIAVGLSADNSAAKINDISEYTQEAFKQLGEEEENMVTGIPTGLKALDKLTKGWQDSELIYIAGRPSMGKTSLALCSAREAAKAGHTVGYISSEQIPRPLTMRLIKQEARVSERAPESMSREQRFAKLRDATTKIEDLDLYLTEQSGLRISDLKSLIRRLVTDQGCDLVFFDYFQLLQAPEDHSGRKSDWMGDASRALKAEAKRQEVPLCIVAQLNRSVENRGGDKRPQLSDLREAGQMEEDADVVAFVYRAERYGIVRDESGESTDGKAEIIVAKNRNRRVGTAKVAFIEHCTRFEDLSYRSDSREEPGSGGSSSSGSSGSRPGGPSGDGAPHGPTGDSPF